MRSLLGIQRDAQYPLVHPQPWLLQMVALAHACVCTWVMWMRWGVRAGCCGGDAVHTQSSDLIKISRFSVKKSWKRGEKKTTEGEKRRRGREGAPRHGRDFLIGTP